MIRIPVDRLLGGEILAEAVLTKDYKVLLTKGTVLRTSYIERIKANGITSVSVDDNSVNICKKQSAVAEEIRNESKSKVTYIMKQHDFGHNEGLREVIQVADEVLTEVLANENVINEVFDIKARSTDIYDHSLEVCVLSTITALKMGFQKDQVKEIAIGALLHDIGLKYIVVHYDNCSIETMAKPEKNEYLKHPVYGYSSLKESDWLSFVSRQIILYHHECQDGSGYPLHATKVTDECSIVSVCDTFDEMICGIGYEPRPVYEAVEYLRSYRGLRFDEKSVLAFVSSIALYPVGSEVVLNTGEHAIVIRQNNGFPDRPVLKLIGSIQEGNGQIKEMNMMECYNVFIVAEVK